MRLFNGHKRVLLKNKLSSEKFRRLKNEPYSWRKILTADVVKFVDDLEKNNLAGSKEDQKKRIRQLLHSPATFFSRPKNVPLELRKQIYL
jgi:hypothetical protein